MSITILDGGMGQELLARSGIEPTGLWSTQLLMDSPELVYGVHNDYFLSGAQIATTCTYPLHRDRLKPFDMEHKFETFHRQACEIALKARNDFGYEPLVSIVEGMRRLSKTLEMDANP